METKRITQRQEGNTINMCCDLHSFGLDWTEAKENEENGRYINRKAGYCGPCTLMEQPGKLAHSCIQQQGEAD